MSSSRLDLSERYRLHALYETGMSMRAIADAVARATRSLSGRTCHIQHAEQTRTSHVQPIGEDRR
ncbi:helix-turn-helix domain-containing protein, partial [Xanthomonas oryzae]|uniref:helix-turn-helix domain-containing protein n=1 Tax=Xanthomonas oryzae TaxID=347 RepID=UPI000AB33990